MTRADQDHLAASELPTFFEIGDASSLRLPLPPNRHGQSVRVFARSLSVMQKEAIAVSARSGKAWRLASDEGPYLNGFDSAPCPLSFLTVGMVASYMNEILALAGQRAVAVRQLVLVQDNYYTMEGSALNGTMTGGALPVELEVHIDADADDGEMYSLIAQAVDASPLNGLMRMRHESLFTLTMNGGEIDTGETASLQQPAETDPADVFSDVRLNAEGAPKSDVVHRLEAVEAQEGVIGGAGSSLQAAQKRKLHLRATCRLRPDGVKEVTQELFSPLGSTYRFLSDETEEFGGRGLAPDAATYMSAGIAFCFMTQLGRYAKITKKNLTGYSVVQDTHFSLGGASGGTGRAGLADPVETHTYLTTTEEEEFARRVLKMGEQTCFLHAFCRTELKTTIRLRRADGQI